MIMSSGYNNYTIDFDQLLGKGGFCRVYKATDPHGRVVAMKIPNQVAGEDTWNPENNRKFQHEAMFWTNLCMRDISGVVKVYGHGIRPHPWLAMELMEGGTLRERLEVGLSLREVLIIIKPIILCLTEVHFLDRIHRDIKPENILFTKNGVPKLGDWGLGKVLLEPSLSSVGIKGTLKYLAPEQFRQNKQNPLDQRTDIYQIGAVFYEMVTGQPPFPGDDIAVLVNQILNEEIESPRKLNSRVPKVLSDVIQRCLEKERVKRYRDLTQVLGDLLKVERFLEMGGDMDGVMDATQDVETFAHLKNILENPPHFSSTGNPMSCTNCGNLISTTNNSLRCYGCSVSFCEVCESWFRVERKRGEAPYCETCFAKKKSSPPQGAEKERSSKPLSLNARQAVESHSSGRTSVSGMGGLKEGVFHRVSVSGMNNQVRVVVLTELSLAGMNNGGTAWLAPGARVSVSGMGNRVSQHSCSWEELHQIIQREFRR